MITVEGLIDDELRHSLPAGGEGVVRNVLKVFD